MRRFYFVLTLFLSLFDAVLAQVQGNNYNNVVYELVTPLQVNGVQGVSAPFAGKSNDFLIVAGGCNFPDVPAAQGGDKVFYDKIFAYSYPFSSKEEWKEIGRMPRAKAYGASVTVPDGVIVIGGTDGKKSYGEVSLLKYDGITLQQKSLPPLPIGLDNMGAAYGNGYVYVAGGQSNGEGSFTAYRLAYPNGTAWEILPDMSGSVRLQPSCAVQNGATNPCFYVMGGFTAASGKTTGVVHNDGVYFNTLTQNWDKVSPIALKGEMRALVGASAVSTGCAHIVFMGGVNYSIFEAAINSPTIRWQAESRGDTLAVANIDKMVAAYMHHPVEWYKFNHELLVYHTITDTWTVESESPLLARAGAAVVPFDNQWVVVNGESKPGIRSADVTVVHVSSVTDFGWLNWTVLIVYLLGMLALGFRFMKREKSADDFFKGGGRLPGWAVGISIYATMLSAITYLAYPAKSYATDWTYYPMVFTILLVAFPVIHYYLPFFRRLNVTSAYEYLEYRFNGPVRLMASALFIVFMISRTALVLYLPSLALTAVTGIDIFTCLILMGLITILYSTMGGLEAVVWGNVVQGFILIGGAVFALAYIILGTEGGVGEFVDIALADDKLKLFDWSFDYRSATFWVILIGGIANNFISYTSDQTIIQRYMITKEEKSASRGVLLNGLMSVLVSVIFFAIGTGLYVFYKTHPSELNFMMEKSDTIFPFYMMSQLPSGWAGLLVAAVFAATMSTLSSNINSISTAFSIDFYKRWHPTASEKTMVYVARKSCLMSGVLGLVLALLMATWDILSLLDFFQEILGLLYSGLGSLFFMGLFMPRIGGKSALVGFCTGIVCVFLVRDLSDVSFLLYGAIGFAVSIAVAYLSSYVLKDTKSRRGLTWRSMRYGIEDKEE